MGPWAGLWGSARTGLAGLFPNVRVPRRVIWGAPRNVGVWTGVMRGARGLCAPNSKGTTL